MWLFEKVPPLSVSTIKGYRSTLSSTLPNGIEITQSAEIAALIRNLHTARPRVTKFCPSWDFNLVLNYLMCPSFEPLTSSTPEYLTLKTVFLLLFASGRRVSEIHALTVDNNCLRFNKSRTEVRLLTEPGFLAKNQKPGEASRPIVIPALTNLVGTEGPDRFLCPVRALNAYLVYSTQPSIRQGRRRLFIPFDPTKRNEIDPRQISRWMTKLIRLAYIWGEKAPPESKVFKTHDIRGLSASWAAFNGVALPEIMRAAFWKGKSTFHDHYLKHLAAYAEGLFSFGPLVAAQSVIVPPSQAGGMAMDTDSGLIQRQVPAVPRSQGTPGQFRTPRTSENH